MAEYAAVKDGAVVEYRQFAAPPPDTSRKGFAWLPVLRSTSGAGAVSDPAVTTVLADKVTVVTPLRDKTAGEIDADKGARVSAFDLLAFQVLFNHENRIRALEGKAAITGAQFRAALKGML